MAVRLEMPDGTAVIAQIGEDGSIVLATQGAPVDGKQPRPSGIALRLDRLMDMLNACQHPDVLHADELVVRVMTLMTRTRTPGPDADAARESFERFCAQNLLPVSFAYR